MVNLLSEKSKKSKCKHNDNVDDNDNDVVDKLQQENNSPLTAARAREGEGEERAAGSGQQSAVSSQRAAGSSQQSAVGGQAAAVNVAVPVGKLYNEMFDEITRQYADGVKTQTMTLLERLGIDTIQAKRERLFLFGQHLKEEGVTEKTRSDFKQHFVSWVKLRLEIEARENENMSKSISSTKKIASNGNNSSTSRAAARLHNTGDFDGAEPKSDF